jgi:hypothetical protein
MATQGTLYTVKPNFLPDSAANRDGHGALRGPNTF